MTVNVASNKTTNALVDVEIYNGSTKSFQRFWDGQPFTANVSRQLTATWTVPASEATTVHVVKVGVFGPGWNGMAFWSDDVARITVAASGGSTTTQPPATTTTVKPTTTTQPTTTQPTTDHDNGEADDDDGRADDHSSADNWSLLHVAAGIGPAV